MKLNCPKCGREVKRFSGGEDAAGGGSFSLALLLSGDYWCERCSRVSKAAFPPDQQKQINRTTVGYVVLSIVCLAVILGATLLGLLHSGILAR